MKAFIALAALAFISGVAAAPLTTLTVSANGNNQQVTPNFDTYKDECFRYVSEINSITNNAIRIGWTGPASIQWRYCGSSLQTPSAATGFSYCSTGTAYETVLNGNAIERTIPPGIHFYEIKANQGGLDYFYIVQIWIVDLPNNVGYSMPVLEPAEGFFASVFLPGQAAYAIQYVVNTNSPTVRLTYGAQKSVYQIEVQVRTNGNCLSLPTTASRTVINSRSSSLPLTDSLAALQGQYTFSATVGGNCVRFWNRVLDTQQGGENEQSISVYVNVYNCAVNTNCNSCTDALISTTPLIAAPCGWCGTKTSVGNCYSGTEANPSSTVPASFQCSRTLVPRSWSWIASECPPDTIKGDPRIQGLQGQDFQVHGMPNEYFNLVSSPIVQLNSRFVYLDSAKCDNFTACFSHPGTYIDELGLQVGADKVRVVAGSITEGTRVFINGKEIQVAANKHAAGKITVTFNNKRQVVLRTPQIAFTVSNSDKFFNVETQLIDVSLLDKGSKLQKIDGNANPAANTLMHGLIGQTWLNNVYAGNREYEGEVADYQVQDGLWGSDFRFNLYK